MGHVHEAVQSRTVSRNHGCDVADAVLKRCFPRETERFPKYVSNELRVNMSACRQALGRDNPTAVRVHMPAVIEPAEGEMRHISSELYAHSLIM